MFSTSAGIERADKQFEAKLQAELFKNATKVIEGEPFNLGIGLAVQFETKALDAAITTQKFDLKLATLTANVEGDFSKWMNTEHFEVKGSVSLEISFGPEAAKQLLTIAKAARDLEKVMRFEAKYGAAHARVSGMRKVDLSDLAGLSDDKARALFNEIEARKSALRELNQLEGMRGRFKRMADAASKQVRRAGKRLSSSAGGKILRKLGAKVLSKVFTKFIPVVNAISTMQDLYDIGEHLAGIEWGEVMSRIMNGGEDGTILGTAQTTEADAGGASGDGLQEEELGDAAAFGKMLAEHEAIALHGKAAKVMALLLGAGGGSLEPAEAYEINGLVPDDLSEQEMEQMRTLVVSIGANEADRVNAVQRAIDIVRPRGRRAPLQGASAQVSPEWNAHQVKARTGNVVVTPSALQPLSVDLAAELARVASVTDKGVFIPSIIEVAGFRLAVTQRPAMLMLHNPDDTPISVFADVTPIDAPAGVRDGNIELVNGKPIAVEVKL